MTTFSELELIHEAGYSACRVSDLAEGDEIMIEPEIRPGTITEMVVGVIVDDRLSDGFALRRWIGTLPSGMQLHCDFRSAKQCWRKSR